MQAPSTSQDRSEVTFSEQVAAALLQRGEAFGREEPRRVNEELAAYAELIQRFGESEKPAIQKLVLVAMLNKAEALDHQGTSSPYAEQLEIYNDAIHRFGESAEPILQESIAQAMLKKADVLGWQEQPDLWEEIATYEALIQRFAASSESAIRKCVAQAMYEKGRAFRRLEPSHLTEAMASLDELIQCFGADVEPAVCDFVLSALSLKACWLSCDERPSEAIEAYDEVIRYARLNSHLEFSSGHEADALRRKGNACLDLNPPLSSEATALYDEVIERFGNSEDINLLVKVSETMLDKGEYCSNCDRPEEAVAIYDEIISCLGKGNQGYVYLRTRVSRAILRKAQVFYVALDRTDDAIALYDELIEHSDGSWNLKYVFYALFNKGCILVELEFLDAASAVYSDLIKRFEELSNRRKSFRNDEMKKIYEKAVEINSSICKST